MYTYIGIPLEHLNLEVIACVCESVGTMRESNNKTESRRYLRANEAPRPRGQPSPPAVVVSILVCVCACASRSVTLKVTQLNDWNQREIWRV
jgi:hypothetical protein